MAKRRKPKMRFHMQVEDLTPGASAEGNHNLSQNTLLIMASIATFLADHPLAWAMFQAWGEDHQLGQAQIPGSENWVPHGQPGHVCGTIPGTLIQALQPHILQDLAEYCIEAHKEGEHVPA
jgi:hypothetical protein